MPNPELLNILPQLASGSAHTHTLGFKLESVDGKKVRLRAPYKPEFVGDPLTGVLSGGLVSTLLDHVGGLSVWLALDQFQSIATLDLRVDYMRAAAPGRDLIAEAHCYRLNRTMAFVRAWAFEDDPSDPVAASQAAYIIHKPSLRKDLANAKGGAA
ncbi:MULTISPECIES: PaaI family thioesterase [unclassified Brevundimonas]|uniref:PaaI family thioesterase n=1 Tax=unclassified Brevundimonas TaxID=2622653 RepID=UPI0025C02C5A|nr:MULTISPECIES: PaaI family thioesterase [unclassified Brevundimonas]